MDEMFSVWVGDLHENGLGCEFEILDDDGLVAVGWLKCDGCVNWKTVGKGFAHFCEPENVMAFAMAFRKVWNVCADKMGDSYIGTRTNG